MQVLMAARRGAEDKDHRFELAYEMAKVAEERLQSRDRAIEVWRTVLREKDFDPRVVGELRRLYELSEKWSALVELLKDEFEHMPDAPDQQEARIAKLLEPKAGEALISFVEHVVRISRYYREG